MEITEDMHRAVIDTLGIGYFERRYGKEAIKEGYGLGIDIAKKTLQARDKVGRYTKLAELESAKGVGIDKRAQLSSN